ncbi:helix-turn-helix domain-containing protein [Leuconostoc pseudomesenteroides]|uniref:helix-turn-helix domain-containing protein n=1 Tax=Leuconostoc pseudomesenteroides TaxID=33968 RepID=UPI0039ECCB3F
MNNTQIPFLLSRKEAAAFLGMSVNTFDRYIRPNPNLKSLMVGDQIRYPQNLLIDFINKQSNHH